MLKKLLVPSPADPYVIFPGFFFASATSSSSVFHGAPAFTSTTPESYA